MTKRTRGPELFLGKIRTFILILPGIMLKSKMEGEKL